MRLFCGIEARLPNAAGGIVTGAVAGGRCDSAQHVVGANQETVERRKFTIVHM